MKISRHKFRPLFIKIFTFFFIITGQAGLEAAILFPKSTAYQANTWVTPYNFDVFNATDFPGALRITVKGSSAYLYVTDATGVDAITANSQSGIALADTSTSTEIDFWATNIAAANTVMKNLRVKGTSSSSTFSVYAAPASLLTNTSTVQGYGTVGKPFYVKETDHWYEYSNDGTELTATWANAKTAAAAKSFANTPGYLVAINSATENTKLLDGFTQLSKTSSWTSGTDAAVDGTWIWSTGTGKQDDGLQFWSGNQTGSAYNGAYDSWGMTGSPGSRTEPNGATTENCLQLTTTIAYTNSTYWNDAGCSASLAYYTEFGSTTHLPYTQQLLNQGLQYLGSSSQETITVTNGASAVNLNSLLTDDLVISGYPSASDLVRVKISRTAGNGLLSLSSVPAGVSGVDSQVLTTAAATLTFTATQANANLALANLQFASTDTSSSQTTNTRISVEVSYAGNDGDSSYKFNATNGHFYQFIAATITPTDANTAASAKNFRGLGGYLASITSASENSFISTYIVGGPTSFAFGGSDTAVADTWRYLGTNSPENGLRFWTGKAAGSRYTADGIDYSNWNTGEPNSDAQDCTHIYSADNATAAVRSYWDDISCSGNVGGYIVEFGGNTNSALALPTTRTIAVTINWPTITNGAGNECIQSVFTTTGATVTYTNGNCIIKFASGTNKWSVPAAGISFSTLVLGGGGGGGSDAGGGGGGGGAYTASLTSTQGSVATLTVGAGGNPGIHTTADGITGGTAATSGGSSSLAIGATTLTANGGSGGISGNGLGTAGQAGAGGTATGTGGTAYTGGAGGAGKNFAVAGTGDAGNGGTLTSNITGTNTVYGGGGGGGANNATTTIYSRAAGGLGGGGLGGGGTDTNFSCATAGETNLGGGGGGGRANGSTAPIGGCSAPGTYGRNGNYGGSGVVYISYRLVLDPPVNLRAVTNNSTSISLTWSAPTAPAGVTITGYDIYRATVTNNTVGSYSKIATANITSYSDTSVSADTEYAYKLQTVAGATTSTDYSLVVMPSTYGSCTTVESTITVAGVSKTVVQFKTTGTCRWTAPAALQSNSAEYLVVGGGASGTRGYCNYYWGQGGGGGAVTTGSSTFAGTITIKVGSGGAGAATQDCAVNHSGNPGEQSKLLTFTANGGSGGTSGPQSFTNYVGRVGGTSGNGNLGATGAANNGSGCITGGCGAGGGGGAGGAGGLAIAGVTDARNGGVGTFSSITGTSTEYGSGGAGRSNTGLGTATGGGGSSANGGIGQANTGGGGSDTTSGYGAGGSGIVIVRYNAGPTITSVSPTSGTTSGGAITITGTNFISGATAAIGGNSLTNVTVVSATSITATVPAISAGTYDVTVTTTGGTATLSNGYTTRGSLDVNWQELNFDYSNHTNITSRSSLGDCGNNTNDCIGKAVGDKVLFQNVITRNGVTADALVTTMAETNATITKYEVGANAGGLSSYFQIDANISSANGYVSFKFEFYLDNLFDVNNPDNNRVTLDNVNVTGIDIDYYQFNQFYGLSSYTRATTTRLTPSPNPPASFPADVKFQGSSSIGNNDIKDQVVTSYASFNSFTINFGASISSSNDAYFGVAFKALAWTGGTPSTTGGATYNLSYDGNGSTSGTVPTTQTGKLGDNLTVATNSGTLARAGYTFAGWNTAADGSGTSYAAGSTIQMPNNGATLYAQWTGTSYTLTYNANGGSGAPANQTSLASATVNISATQPTRSGYTFAGWNTLAAGSGTDYSAGGTLTMPASNLTIYAKWTQNTYNVSYDANGGSGAPSTQSGASGASVTLSSTLPTRTGYTFNGWNTAQNGSGTSYLTGASITMPTGGLTLYAKWTALINYVLTYVANGGSNPPSAETRAENELFALSATAPTRTGYTFSGWNTASNGSGTDYASSGNFTMPSNNASLYAKWTANNYSITYNVNGGNADGPATLSNQATDSSVTLSSTTPTRSGYTFNGWNTAANGSGNTYQASGAITMPGNNLTLYAQWTPNSYTISYSANGGTTPPTSQSATTGSNVTLASLGSMVRTGYTFAGWDGAADGSGTDYAAGGTLTMPGNNLTLYARWTVRTFTVTYVAGTAGATTVTGVTMPSTSTVNYAATHTVGSPGSATKTISGTTYTFAGWSDGSRIYQSSGSLVMGAANVTLTAQWIALYDVKYFANGGAGTSPIGDSECITSSLCTDGQSITLAAGTVFTRAGYTFNNWNSGATTYNSAATVSIDSTHYLFYANWTANNNTLSYDANGGANAPTSATVATDSTATAAVVGSLARSGYSFVGWNTNANGSGTYYSPGNTFVMPPNDVTLYAIWTADSYTVAYNANGGANAPADQSAQTDSTVTVAGQSLMVRTGYTFIGWNTAANNSGTARTAASTFTMPANNVVLYAQWTVNSYNLTYDDNSGTGGPGSGGSFNTGATVTVSNTAPTRTGYNFLGWNTSRDGTGTSYTAGSQFAMPGSATTLYAQWVPLVSYLITYIANGGTGAPSAQPEAEQSTVTVSGVGSMTRSGFTFTGWNTAANGSGTARAAASTFTMPSNNVTLYAQWSSISYTLSYDVNGGSGTYTSETGSVGDTKTVTNTAPTKTGYTFLGWNTVVDGSGTSYLSGSNFTLGASNSTLYAQWNIDSFQLNYDANGGINAPNSSSKNYGVTVTASAVGSISRTGYNFLVWNTAANGSGTSYIANSGTFTMPNSDLTLYAQWSPKSFILNYNSNGGSGAPIARSAITGSNVQVAFATPIRSGYTFVSWNDVSDGTGTTYFSNNSFTMPPSNLTLYAQWNAITYTLSYNGNTSTGGAAPAVQTGNIGSQVTVSGNTGTFVKTGYWFSGWNTSANGSGSNFGAGSVYTFAAANRTLFAQWTPNDYSLVFNANGGSGAPNPITLATAATTTVPDVGSLVRPGYTFAGWNTAADGSGATTYVNGTGTATFTMPAGNTTLYAVWTAITYNIIYDANGGTGTSPAQQSGVIDSTQNVSDPTLLSKANSVFAGWNTAANGSGTSYTSGSVITFSASDITLYAQWTGVAVNIVYQANGGANAPSTQSELAGTTATLSSSTPTRTSYAFNGWSDTPTSANATYNAAATVTVPTADLVLFAVWSANSSNNNNNGGGSIVVQPIWGTNKLGDLTIGDKNTTKLQLENFSSCVLLTGSLPEGLVLDTATCTISGTPTKEGPYTFTLLAKNENAQIQRSFNGVIIKPSDKPKPTIIWPTPNPIIEGTPLSGVQLNAKASVPGKYIYDYSSGKILPNGKYQIKVRFIPDDSNYAEIETTVELIVLKKTAPAATPITTYSNQSKSEPIINITTAAKIVINSLGAGLSTARVSGQKILVTPIITFSGNTTVITTVTDKGSTNEVIVPVTILPLVPEARIYSPLGSKATSFSWQTSPNAISYNVYVDGKLVCEKVIATSCSVAQLIGPKSAVKIISNGNDGTKSLITPMVYKSPKNPITLTVVNFDTAKFNLKPNEQIKLRNFAKLVGKYGFKNVRIYGHTDSDGGIDNNVLSQNRAKSTLAFLKRLLPGVKFSIGGFADKQPVATNATSAGKADNRRAEATVF